MKKILFIFLLSTNFCIAQNLVTIGTGNVNMINGVTLSSLPNGLLKLTAGVPSIAIAADFPTLNQNTTGNAQSVSNGIYSTGSYNNPTWLTGLDYSKLIGTVPTWNQNTTGNAATVTNGIYTTGSYSNPTWLTGLDYSKLIGTVPIWNQNTTGSAASLTTGRTFSITGDMAYTSGSFNGTGNVTGVGTIAPNAVTFAKMQTIPANTMIVNNTGSAAVPTTTTFQSASGTYSGTITWTGTTDPTSIASQTYWWQRVGNLTTLNIKIEYSGAGVANTAVTCSLPSGAPAPLQVGAAGEKLAAGFGYADVLPTGTTAAGGVYLTENASANGYNIILKFSSLNVRVINMTVIYPN